MQLRTEDCVDIRVCQFSIVMISVDKQLTQYMSF